MKHYIFSNGTGNTVDIVAVNIEAAKVKLAKKVHDIKDYFLVNRKPQEIEQ